MFNKKLILHVLLLMIVSAIENDHSSYNNNFPRIIGGNINITSFVGDTVILPCEVANLAKYHVIWLKFDKQNNNIPLTLTVGYEQFSRNMRYRVVRQFQQEQEQPQEQEHNQQKIEAWNFEIRKVTMNDQGLYECMIKINSKHKIKAYVNLEVKPDKEYNNAEALAIFSNNYIANKQFPEKLTSLLSSQTLEKVQIPEKRILQLECNATSTNVSLYRSLTRKSSRFETIQWYKNGKPLFKDSSRRLKKFLTDNLNHIQMEIDPIEVSDQGFYQCKKNDKILRNVYVEVIHNNAISILSLSCYLFTSIYSSYLFIHLLIHY